MEGAARLESLGGGLYKGGVLIIQKAHHKTSILEVCDAPSDVCWRPQADLNAVDGVKGRKYFLLLVFDFQRLFLYLHAKFFFVYRMR